jgi:glucose/arabinose dehydrogenase
MTWRVRSALILLLALVLVPAAAAQRPACAPDNGGLTLPAGFCAAVVADNLGQVRHFAVAGNGDIVAAVRGRDGSGGFVLLYDTDADGTLDGVKQITGGSATGIHLAPDAVYYAPDDKVLRFPWHPGAREPAGPADTIVHSLPVGGHAAKTLTLGADGALLVNIGSRSNSCQVADRQSESPGHQPCTELDTRAGIWRFDARRTGQTQADGSRFATGLRNAEAIAVEPVTGTLYAAIHGRDQLTQNWGFSEEDGAENPAEEFGPVPEGADYGWPYCYYAPAAQLKVLAPEYGGDGRAVGDCGQTTQPAIGFPGHWAPMAVVFYTGSQFPAPYRGGAFISFHGSWNRAPLPQAGYRVVFAPFRDGRALGTWETFAAPAGAHDAIRPMGLAVGPDGSLYVGADREGKIWRVMYTGGGNR